MTSARYFFSRSQCCRWLTCGLLVLAFSSCSEEVPPPPPPAAVRTYILGEKVERAFRRFPGEVKALQTSELSFDVAGRMVERPASQGLIVRQGDLLARLDPETFQARLDSATARLNHARDEFQRRLQLRQRGVIAASELESFRVEFEVAEAAERQARRALEDTRLLAPFDGRVARTLVNNFQTVQANQPILLFQNIAQLEVDIEVPERVMMAGEQGLTAVQVRERIEARAEFPALPGREFPLVLKSFSTAATLGARTFRVTFLLDPPADNSILPGMTCTVLVRRNPLPEEQTGPEEVFPVPVNAVTPWEENAVVWKILGEPPVVEPVPVELEGPIGDKMLVRSEVLQPGDEIVATGARFLTPGRSINRLSPAAH